MRIRQELLPQQRRNPAGSSSQYAAPTELTHILETGSYKDSAPTELETRQELETRHSEFQNLVGVDCSAGRCRPRKRGRSIGT
jgi:hypothetical protein